MQSHQVPVQNPVGVQVVDTIQDLVQQTLDHALGYHDGLLVGLGGAMELDDVPQVVLCIVKQQPDLAVHVRQEHADQVDDIGVLQLPQQLHSTDNVSIKLTKD